MEETHEKAIRLGLNAAYIHNENGLNLLFTRGRVQGWKQAEFSHFYCANAALIIKEEPQNSFSTYQQWALKRPWLYARGALLSDISVCVCFKPTKVK